jgi:DsbE subfamily thiol:disulfide oxidoreductase
VAWWRWAARSPPGRIGDAQRGRRRWPRWPRHDGHRSLALAAGAGAGAAGRLGPVRRHRQGPAPDPLAAGWSPAAGTFSSADLEGQPAIVNIWASWCGPCVQEHPLLLDLAATYDGDLQVVGILYQDTTDAALAFLARYGDGGWPDVLDGDGRIAVDLGVTGPPETFFVDAGGVVRYRHVGPLTDAVLDAQLAAIGVDR